MKTRNMSDWAVAFCVIASSAVLFTALALALSGRTFQRPGRVVKVYFHEATGVAPSSEVRYGGAQAGRVGEVRMLTPQERIASGDPANVVQVKLELSPSTPPIPRDVLFTIQSDTVLSDKFVEISGGNPSAPVLTGTEALQGVPPATFDELSRTLEDVLQSVQRIAGAAGGSGLTGHLGDILGDAQTAITQANALIKDGRSLVQTGNTLIEGNQARINDTVVRLNNASAKLESLATNGDTLVRQNAGSINATTADLRVILRNLKITTTWSKYFFNDLYLRPQRLLWGGTPVNVLPAERQILEDSMKTVPGR